MRLFFGLLLGALLMALYAYRAQIKALYENRKALSSADRAVEGAKQAVDAVGDLLDEVT
jgi:hypothetical protein